MYGQIMEHPAIKILSPDVVNEIAAGEVVERPVSVVKELVENALDAGARHIDVKVEGGGVGLIRVVDDGCGMTPKDAHLCLERYATSKLRRCADLWGIQTMGFRGEALPSIAAVSKLTLLTRPAEMDVGYQFTVEGHSAGQGEPAGCRTGTQVEVRELFFNTPARRKFLKSQATELAHITDGIMRVALGAPGVHFTLTVEDRKTIDLPSCTDHLERAKAAFGRRGKGLFGATLKVEGLSLEACLSPPEASNRTAQSVIFIVNNRFIRDRALIHAVTSGYGELLARGRYPLAVVHLQIDPTQLDVNVHPQKVEVRLADPSRVFSTVRRCIRDAVAKSPWEAPMEVAREYGMPPRTGYEDHKRRLQQATRRFWSARQHVADTPGPSYGAADEGPAAAQEEREGFFANLRLVGQVMGTYLICEAEEELVLIDQHAAHERVTFERLHQSLAGGQVSSQRLLIPATLSLEGHLDLAAAARTHDPWLRRLGVELEHFGGESWTIRAIPAQVGGADPVPLVQDVLSELAAVGESDILTQKSDDILIKMACHGSVRAGRVMELKEVEALLGALDQIDFSTSCPHGRPVMVRLSRADLARRFGRS